MALQLKFNAITGLFDLVDVATATASPETFAFFMGG